MLIRLLGEVSAGEDAATLVVPRGRTAASVLALLALAKGRLVATESLIDELWEDPPDTARNSLQVAVSGLRKQFGSSLIDGTRAGYRLRADLVRIDWVEVEQYLAAARGHLEGNDPVSAEAEASTAHGLFAGSELAGVDSASLRASRGLAQQLRRAASMSWAQALVMLGRRDEAVEVLREETGHSPLDEPLHVLLMTALREQGRPAEGLEVFEGLRRRLDDELGAMPSESTVDEFHRLLDSGSETEVRVSRAPTQTKPQISLPTSATPLVGRETELDQLVRLMVEGNALVTLLGPGGIGKTRLAVPVARKLAEVQARPAIFLDLTLSRSDRDSRQLLADLLGSETDSAIAALENSRMLIVVDNAEHLLDETAILTSELLRVAGVQILVTSRSPLGLTHERRFEVDGLDADSFVSPAVQLLVNRSGMSSFDAERSASELQALAQRCDGIPLVMELLGSALQWEAPKRLLASLGQQMGLIHDYSRDRAARHTSVRSAVDWSIQQLSAEARQALGLLATVRGTFRSTTAASLLARVGIDHPQSILAELIDTSLLKRVREPGEIVFRILEPIRIVAEELAEQDAERNLRMHAEVYLGLLAEAHDRVVLSTVDFDDLITGESPNLSLAAETMWRQDATRAVGEIGPLLYGWYRRDRRDEVKSWSTLILNSSQGSAVHRAQVAIVSMSSMVGYNDWDRPYLATEFEELNAQAAQVADNLSDEWHRRWVGGNHIRWLNAGEFDDAEAWLSQMRITSPIAAFWVHNSKGLINRFRGNWRAAIGEFEAALAELDPISHATRALPTRAELALARTMLGEFDSAEKELRDMLAFTESRGLGFERMNAQINLAFLGLNTGTYQESLVLTLAALDWSGASVFGNELAIYAAIALHALGDDSSAHALASLAATSFRGAFEGKPSVVDEPYLRPFWDELLAGLPALVTDPAGGWDTGVARRILADAIERLPAGA